MAPQVTFSPFPWVDQVAAREARVLVGKYLSYGLREARRAGVVLGTTIRSSHGEVSLVVSRDGIWAFEGSLEVGLTNPTPFPRKLQGLAQSGKQLLDMVRDELGDPGPFEHCRVPVVYLGDYVTNDPDDPNARAFPGPDR